MSSSIPSVAARQADLRQASRLDTLAVLAEVVAPTLAKGPIIRRPRMVGLSERLDLDGRAVKRMQRLRARYGQGPLMLSIPGRDHAVILSTDHVRLVLEKTPHEFSPASTAKRSALAHFEPRIALISEAPERIERRRFNEDVLQHGSPVHTLARSFQSIVDQEAAVLLERENGSLDWDAFTVAWHRIVRRVVLGDGAADDDTLTDMLAKLRAAANWGFLHPGRYRLRRKYHDRLNAHLARAEPGSLAELVASAPKSEATAPSDQVSQWLFAFDPGGMTAFRALALLAAHPQAQERARAEAVQAHAEGEADLPFLRASIAEALRLWPTTPAILRQTTQETDWNGRRMPKDTSILIFAPFFHRDDETLPYAHAYNPELWLGVDQDQNLPLVPFSAGPGLCPGRHVVSMVAAAVLGRLVSSRHIELQAQDRLRPDQGMPSILNNYTLRFALRT